MLCQLSYAGSGCHDVAATATARIQRHLDGMRGSSPKADLGTTIASRFRGLGLTDEIAERRGHPARGADLDGL